MLDAGEVTIPEVAPWGRAELTLPCDISAYKKHDQEVHLTIRFSLRNASPWAGTSQEVAWWQHQISTACDRASTSAVGSLSIENTRTRCSVRGHGFNFIFDRVRGCLIRWTSAGADLVEVDPKTRAAILPCFWRPPTDNDRPIALPYWKRFGVDALTSQVRSFTATCCESAVEISSHTYVSPPVLCWGYHVRTLYTIFPSGSLSIKVNLQPTGPAPENIPRIGLNLRLPKHLSQAKWLGLGPNESYPDKKLAQKIGIWSRTVPELETPYDVPQENGNRMETRWLKLSNESSTVGIKATSSKPFSWTAGRHSAEMLEYANHPCDLVPEDVTLLNLSSRVAGVGTAACGPGVREDLQVKVREEAFDFVLERVPV